MDISIPDSVVLYTEEHRGGQWHWGHYCFPHAVLRALEGERIRLKLSDNGLIPSCNDCDNFGPPQSHELGSLRR